MDSMAVYKQANKYGNTVRDNENFSIWNYREV